MQQTTQRLARAGLVTRGVLYAIIGWLAVQMALGDRGRRVDQKGVMSTLLRQPLGRLLVLALALGFLAYATWRLIEGVWNPEDDGALKRLSAIGRCALNLGLAVTAFRVVARGAQEASGHEQQDATAHLLGWGPVGQWLVVAAGLFVVGIGLWSGWQAVSGRFEKQLKSYEMSKGERPTIAAVARVGLIGRMVAWVLSGGFIVRAAVRFDPAEGVGLDASLHELVGESFGPPALLLVGAGLVAFGIHQFSMARYRRVMGT